MAQENQEQQWPGVDAAFGFVIPSYQWTITRFEAVDSRIQTLQAFVLTFTFGLPVIVRTLSENIYFASTWFILGVSFAALTIFLGIVARSWSGITVPSPGVMFEKWLDLDEWTFKKDAIFFAGQHFEDNARLINMKGRMVSWMTFLFILEGTCLFLWIIFSYRQ